MASERFNFDTLVQHIKDIHNNLQQQAAKAVNVALTFRNWMIGLYLSEYELKGTDRAAYGDRLVSDLAKQLTASGVSNCSRRQIYRYLALFRVYPQIGQTLSPQFRHLPGAAFCPPEIVGTPSPQFQLPADKLAFSLSYSHLELLIDIEDSKKRYFYEIECIRGNWSVRELKRQIASLYYERSGLSKNPQKLSELTLDKAQAQTPHQIIRDPYVFEFLGLLPKEVVSESDLESALLDKLQHFLLELGHGFCFEARQKRILIGDEFFFVDIVFYHRKLKCHVLIELKVDDFKHEYLGQLNTYVNWYARHEQTEGDNPPVGILLCTQKNHALVEYALAGMDNQLFVSKYQLELPDKKQMQEFLEEQIAESAKNH